MTDQTIPQLEAALAAAKAAYREQAERPEVRQILGPTAEHRAATDAAVKRLEVLRSDVEAARDRLRLAREGRLS